MPRSIALFPLAFLLCLRPANGQLDACLDKARPATANVGLWTNVGQYFASLTQYKTTLERARFTSLRSTLVALESVKRELIAVVEGRLADNVSGTTVSKEISLRTIPDILKRIEIFTTGLDQQAYDLVALEPLFKNLKIQFDFKRTTTACETAETTASSNPADKEALRALFKDLKVELEAIISAEKQLADFIQKKQ